MNTPRQQADNVTPPRHHTNGSVDPNTHFVPTWTDTRVGSQDHEEIPSRRVVTREWRDGRVERVA